MECRLFERFNDVSRANHTVFKDVRSESSPVSECLYRAVLGNALKVATRFTQPIPLANGTTDSEALSDEMIECDITGFDVPSVLSWREFDSRFAFDCCHSLLFDQREVVSIVSLLVRLPLDEGAGFDFTEISVTAKATSSDGLDFTAFGHCDFGLGGSEDPFDSSSTSHTHRLLTPYQIVYVYVRQRLARRRQIVAG
jgi:hypothetical protein